MTFATVIAHAARRPERRATLERMLSALDSNVVACPVGVWGEPGKPHEWSLGQWDFAVRLAESSDCSHVLLLNDDLVLPEGSRFDNFKNIVRRVIDARPTHIINLYNTHPLALEAQKRGLSWLTSVDGLIGNAYVLPVPALRHFLMWRERELEPGTVEALSEDQLINLWAMQHDALIWHTVPALVDHDVSVPSCFGNTQMRRPQVGPLADGGGASEVLGRRMFDVDWSTDALHVGRVFEGNHRALLTRVKGDRLPLVKRYYELAGQ